MRRRNWGTDSFQFENCLLVQHVQVLNFLLFARWWVFGNMCEVLGNMCEVFGNMCEVLGNMCEVLGNTDMARE